MAWFQSSSLWVQDYAEGLAVLQFDPSGKSSRMSRELIAELNSALDIIEREPRFRALLIRSLKPGRFLQGPDVPGWKSLHASGELVPWALAGQSLWRRVQGFKIPTIAWVNGICLGAGLDLALACDQIVLVDRPSTVVGFSELDVGLIPAWGGLGALVHRMGLQDGIPFALAGRRLGAQEAAQRGLADRVSENEEPDFGHELEQATKRDPNLWNRRTWRQQLLERFERGRRLLYRRVERIHARRLPDDLPAPRLALTVIRAFTEQGSDAGQAAARKAIAELANSAAFANLIRWHELREHATPASSRATLPFRDRTVAILGASPLGMQLLVTALRQGAQVILRETDELRLGGAVLKLVQDLGREIQTGQLTSKGTHSLLGRIRNTSGWKHFDTADLVIDARELIPNLAGAMEEIASHTRPQTPIITVGGAGSITAAGANCKHPERIAGMFLPPPMGSSALVEWRRHGAMGEATAGSIRDWLGGFGWVPVDAADVPGLLWARLMVPFWNELVALMREGADVEIIDDVFLRFGLGRGPLEYLDAVGLETALRLIESVRDSLTPRVEIDPFWTEVLTRGWRGQASGKGFYRHRRGRPRVNDLLVNWLRYEGPISDTTPLIDGKDRRLIRDRAVLLLVNEAYRSLGEGRVGSADALDLTMMLVDWAPHRGGPIRFAHEIGLASVVERLRELSVHGARYEPCARLLEEFGSIKELRPHPPA